jgi:CHAT domain-containing protein/Tfp pilus assembly protein PilF
LASGCTGVVDSPESALARYDARFRQGNFREALREAEAGLSSHPNSSDFWHWRFQLARAEATLRKDGPAAALDLLQSDLPPGPQFDELRARRKWDQAIAKFRLSDYRGSRGLLEEAARIAASANARSLLARIELTQVDVAVRLGDWTAAEERLEDVSRLAHQQNDSSLIVSGLNSLAFLRIHQSRFEEAIYALEQARPLLDEERDATPAAKTFTNLGWCYYKLGELDKALESLKKAEAIDAKTGDSGEQQICLGAIGDVHYQRGDLEAARKNYLRARELASQRGDRFYSAKWLSNLAAVSIELKDWAAAQNYNDKALEIQRKIPDRIGELHSLKNAARVAHGKEQNDDSERIFRQVIGTDSSDPAPVLDAEAGLAKLLAATDRPEKADQQFRDTLALIDSSRSRLVKDDYKVSYLASLMEFYQDYVDWLMSRGKTELALEVVESSRARILNERTGGVRLAQAGRADQYKQLAAKSGSVFLSYWTAPKRSYVWLITPNQIVAYTLPPEARIKRLVENYRALIESLQDPLDIDDPTARELSDALLGSVRPFVREGARVSIVPDGSLYALNFETLPVSGSKRHYWIEDATIQVAPSLNLLLFNPAVSAGAKTMLLIGNPDQADERFPKLPYAAKEIAFVRRHFAPSQSNVVEGKSAAPAAYAGSELGRFAYVHFTAHATANRDSPLDSAIILSRQDGNYRLTARDVLKHPLRADLVTVSACRSAGAKTYAGEGLVGFTWTFFQAGAHNVIAGLWDVSDESTPEIVDRLYDGISGGQPIAGALRSAKLAIMNQNRTFRLPYYWGALQLYSRDRLASHYSR